MTILQALILGIVEGLTEFLPISSTGHLILFSNLLNINQTDFVKSFEIIIQLGTIMAVMFLYIKKILSNKSIIYNLIYAFIPTATIGLLFYSRIKNIMGNILIIPITLIIGGIFIILVEKYLENKVNSTDVELLKSSKNISKKESFILGVIQTLAFIPGVSRSGAIIIGGLLRNVSRKEVVEFSFMLAMPTMIAATGLDVLKNGLNFSNNEWLLIGIGFVTAFIVALLAIKTFLKFITHNSFKSFGWYRIVIGLTFLFILI